MEKEKMFTIAIVKENEETIYYGEVKRVNQQTLNKLKYECILHKQKEIAKEQQLNEILENMSNKISDLEDEIKVLKGEE